MLIQLLEDTRLRFEIVVGAVPEDQWQTAPKEEGWSPAEAAEHLVVTEQALATLIRTKLLSTDPVEPAPDPHKFDAIMLTRIPDRTPGKRRVEAPEWLRPKGLFSTPPEALDAFRKARAETLAFVETTTDPLRNHKMPHPAFGDIDGCQWLIFLAAHTERHVRQIEQCLLK